METDICIIRNVSTSGFLITQKLWIEYMSNLRLHNITVYVTNLMLSSLHAFYQNIMALEE